MTLVDIPQLRSTVELYRIRRALPEDTAQIYELKSRAFGDNYLLYTIFQSPKSQRYLSELLAQDPERSAHCFFVLGQDDRILGYYHAVRRHSEFFLNYIVAAQEVRGKGIGNALLEHYEETGRSAGCRQLVLDVFDSNGQVRDWYHRSGYRQHSSSIQARLSISSLPEQSSPVLRYEFEARHRAAQEEYNHGFSKIDCACGSGRLVLGLIGDRVCKLLSYEGIELEEVVLAVARRFRTERAVLILSPSTELPPTWPVLSLEKSLRLVKPIEPQA